MSRYEKPWKRAADREIWKAWRAGKAPAEIAQRRGCTTNSVYKAIKRVEASGQCDAS